MAADATHEFQDADSGEWQKSRSDLTVAERERLNEIIGREFYRPVPEVSHA